MAGGWLSFVETRKPRFEAFIVIDQASEIASRALAQESFGETLITMSKTLPPLATTTCDRVILPADPAPIALINTCCGSLKREYWNSCFVMKVV